MAEEAKKPAVKKAAKSAAPKKEAGKAAAAKPVKSGKKIKVTQIGSPIGRLPKQEQTLIGLGLNKLHRSRVLEDTPAIRGMVVAVKHLVVVEEAA